MRLRRRKPDYEHIAEMERDIASLPIPTLDERIDDARQKALDARRDPDWTPGRGIVLGPNARPLQVIADTYEPSMVPGQRWIVADHDDVRYVTASSYSVTASTGFYPPRSRIVVATR